MAAQEDLVDFEIIENQKENIQSLPGGRSARELARIFSPRDTTDKLATPSPNSTRTVNDAIRQEFESELQAINESDDPLDVYDRYVKWVLNAYPSTQATQESGLLPLLERAVRAFLSSNHYKNDSRYLRLWLHYIRFFSDSPRETFAFLARHHIGEELALFYEEFAAWLESAGRWAQAEEVYHLGIDREARPVERLVRKFSEFQQRYEQQPQDGPTSPALPKARPALAAKANPFASSNDAPEQQPQQPAAPAAGAKKSKSGKPKMAIFSDAEAAPTSQPALSGRPTKGWDSIGSLQDRKKENTVEAKPWAGETLKAGKKAAPKEKMTIFRDESNAKQQVKETVQSKHIPEHRVSEAVNPRTGRRERVFVNLEAVYPDYKNPNHEISFEELRATSRGWTKKNWRSQKQPLKQISGNAEPSTEKLVARAPEKELPDQFNQKLALNDSQPDQDENRDSRAAKARKPKVREVQGETQTIKMNFDSPTKPKKVRRKSIAEPTMTLHTRAATDEIYSIFNQPLKAETEPADSSDFDDDDDDDDGYTSAGDSTVTGRISAASSDFDDDDTTFHKSFDNEGFDDTRAESVVDGEWTEFTGTRNVSGPSVTDSQAFQPEHQEYTDGEEKDTVEQPVRPRFVPQMPEDYNPPCGPYRDPEIMAQNRLPFMTPIVEQTECSFPSMRTARNLYTAKTPSKPMPGIAASPGTPEMEDLLGLSPEGDKFASIPEDVTLSPSAMKSRSSPLMPFLKSSPARKQRPVIENLQCNPTDKSIRKIVIDSLSPPISSYPGYHTHPEEESHYAPGIQKYIRNLSKRPKSGDEASFNAPILEFEKAERGYIIRRELGAGAYAPVYLAESVDGLDMDSELDGSRDSQSTNSRKTADRYGFEAIKMELGPPNPWEFYMIRVAHERLQKSPGCSRAADSIIRAHELHVFEKESFLVEDYRGQGTLLDLINIIRNEPTLVHNNGEGGLDECLAMFFTVELFRTIEALHKNGVLHGDIKPDNCLVRFDDPSRRPADSTPSLLDLDDENTDPREIHYSPHGKYGWRDKGLTLIDFGRSIDMRAFQPSVQFIADWEPSSHECNEIREMRPWTHQIDLYGVAGTVHVMLFGKYIESVPVRRSGSEDENSNPQAMTRTYRIRETLKRYWEREIWSEVFDLLLNPGAPKWTSTDQDENEGRPSHLATLGAMRAVREKMESWLLVNAEKKGLSLQIRRLEAVFAEKIRKLERV